MAEGISQDSIYNVYYKSTNPPVGNHLNTFEAVTKPLLPSPGLDCMAIVAL